MSEYLNLFLSAFTAFFAIANPIANTPIFIGVTEGKSSESKKRIALRACFVAFLIVTTFILVGKYIFILFGITIPAFKITGGILIFVVGFEMLMSKKSKVHQSDNLDDSDSVAISPLAIPVLAGPGTIVTAMNFVTNKPLQVEAIVITALFVVMLLTYLAFRGSNPLVEKIGENLINVLGKIMGLIIAIIGVGMVIEGIKLGFSI